MSIREVLAEEWFIRALIASTLVGIMCGVIGCFMVLRNMSLIGDAISHAILPGIFVAFIIVGYSSIGFFTGTLLAALLSAVAITWIQDHVKTKNDAAIGIIFTFMFSLGVIGISYLNNQQGVHLDLKDFLFGTILGISNEDILITSVVSFYTLLSIALFYRYLFITTFQPTIAQTMGISVKLIHYFLMLLLSFAVVSALRTVGIILVVAMLITPAATALLLSQKLKKVLVISGIIGAISAILGLVISVIYNTTPGPAMCVVVTFIYFITVVLSPQSGILFKYLRKLKQIEHVQIEDTIKWLGKNTEQSNSVSVISQGLSLKKAQTKKHLDKLITEGVAHLDANGYVLTAKGNDLNSNLVRAHRLWETFLVDEMGLNSAQIHEDAERHEHLLHPEMLDQLDAKLGFPIRDPHGSLIPSKVIRAQNSLLSLKPKSKAYISDQQIDQSIESKLWELGLSAGLDFQLLEIHSDKVLIEIADRRLEIDASLAAKINVR